MKLLAGIKLLSAEPSSGFLKRTSIIHGGLKRTFQIYLPVVYKTLSLKPLVIALHGRGGNSDSMILLTRNGLNSIADREGFIVLYPDGVGMNWNDGRKDHKADDRAHIENIDDVGFISALINMMIGDYGADPGKVYITGISNGAIMAYRLACELSEKIAAIAAVDGNMPGSFLNGCKPYSPVNVLAINNTLDPLVPYNGGTIRTGLTRKNLGTVLSVAESVNFWVDRNQCFNEFPEEHLPAAGPGDETRVTKSLYENPHDGIEVVLYTIHGGGHTWPGGLQYMPEAIIGKTCRNFDANAIIWAFFRKHSKKLQEALNE